MAEDASGPGESATASGRAPFCDWGAGTAVLAAIGALVAGLVLAMPFLIIDSPPEGQDLSTWASVGSQVATAVGLLLIPLLLATRGGDAISLGIRKLGLRRFDLGALKWVGLAVVAYIAILAAYVAVFGEPHQDDIAADFGPIPVQILLIVVLAPLSEETCFRGMLYGGLRNRFPAWSAALIAGVIFGILHLTTGPSAVPPLIVFGVILSFLYEKTGSIWPGILLHALNNCLALISS